ncbi:hypothetical protein DYH09_09370 [bacterium CPR1]|nr:hypothetical protein [bacterium CPR1]
MKSTSGKIARALAHQTQKVVPRTRERRFHSLLFILATVPLFVLTWFVPRHALVAAHAAAARGDLERLERLYSKNPESLSHEDVGGARALHYAALNHQLEAARFLVDHGVEVDATNLQGQSALFYAVSANNPDMVDFLVASGADPDRIDRHGLTPLYLAVARGFPGMVESLAGYRVRTEVEHASGQCVLHEAVLRGNSSIVRLLLRMGADKNRPDRRGETPLQIAQRLKLLEVEGVLRESPTVGAGTVRSKRN